MDWKVGDYRTIIHTFGEAEVAAFAQLTGDTNPLHVDRGYARRTEAGDRVVHGMLAASFVSTLIGTQIPGTGALWNSFQIDWRRMIRIGDTLRIEGRVAATHPGTHSLDLSISGVLADTGEVCFDGSARVMVMQERIATIQETKGMRILVTGASGEIGGAICRRLAADGHSPILWGRDAARLEALAAELGTTWRSVDLTDASEIGKGLTDCLADGPVNGLVHAAAAPLRFGDLADEGRAADLLAHWQISSAAFLQLAAGLLPQMSAGGTIVALLTQAVFDAPPAKMATYVSAKMATWGLVRGMAAEWGPRGIRCNAVSPGLTNTPYTKDMSPRIKQVEAAANPLRRLCSPEDIAEVVAFLCGSGAAFVNGANLPVTGGGRMP